MYRLVLYYLSALFAVAVIFSFLGILSYNPLSLILSALLIVITCFIANLIFSKFFEVPANSESIYITALILVLVITPAMSSGDISFMLWSSVLAMASKYIFAIKRKHIFNPAAIGLFSASLLTGYFATWWVGTLSMLPFVLIGGLLVAKKMIKSDLIVSFFAASLLTIVSLNFIRGFGILATTEKALFYSPLLFFAFVMITEPFTTPPTRTSRVIYGILTGFLFAPQVHIGSFYITPESALLIGNVFSYIVSPKGRLLLILKEKIQIAPDIYDFIFKSDRKLYFKPGQYLEWTMGHRKIDNRGNRRYFTVASSPTEDEIRMGVKFYPESSSFKKSLLLMKEGDKIMASQLAGEFVMPEDQNKKLVFIAGGIGVTPFRSMIKYLLDKGEKRSITFLYSNKTAADIVYKDIFDKAGTDLGIKTVYVNTDEKGMIDAKMIMEEVPDYKERVFYISGPHGMVISFENTLKNLGVKRGNIVTDFFPGFN